MITAVKTHVDHFAHQLEEYIDTDNPSEVAVIYRIFKMQAAPMIANPTPETIQTFLEFWDTAWNNRVGPAHPKYFDSAISGLKRVV